MGKYDGHERMRRALNLSQRAALSVVTASGDTLAHCVNYDMRMQPTWAVGPHCLTFTALVEEGS